MSCSHCLLFSHSILDGNALTTLDGLPANYYQTLGISRNPLENFDALDQEGLFAPVFLTSVDSEGYRAALDKVKPVVLGVENFEPLTNFDFLEGRAINIFACIRCGLSDPAVLEELVAWVNVAQPFAISLGDSDIANIGPLEALDTAQPLQINLSSNRISQLSDSVYWITPRFKGWGFKKILYFALMSISLGMHQR